MTLTDAKERMVELLNPEAIYVHYDLFADDTMCHVTELVNSSVVTWYLLVEDEEDGYIDVQNIHSSFRR